MNSTRRIYLSGMRTLSNGLKQSLMHFSRFGRIRSIDQWSLSLQSEPIPFPALPRTPMDEPVYEQNTCPTCQRVFHLQSQWMGKSTLMVLMFVRRFVLDHLKSKQHKRMLRSTERKTFRRKLDNALPSLLNTLETFRARKEQEESDQSELTDEVETDTPWWDSFFYVFILEQKSYFVLNWKESRNEKTSSRCCIEEAILLK